MDLLMGIAGFILGVLIGLESAEEITSKARIEPTYEIVIKEGVSDTTFIYTLED